VSDAPAIAVMIGITGTAAWINICLALVRIAKALEEANRQRLDAEKFFACQLRLAEINHMKREDAVREPEER